MNDLRDELMKVGNAMREQVLVLTRENEALRSALRGLLPTARHYGGLRDCDVDAINEAEAALGAADD
jgi:hypothetical protein